MKREIVAGICVVVAIVSVCVSGYLLAQTLEPQPDPLSRLERGR